MVEPPTELEIKEEVLDPLIDNVTIDYVESMTSVREELDIKEEDLSEMNYPLVHCPLVNYPIIQSSSVQSTDLPMIAENPMHIPKKKPERTVIFTSKMKEYIAKKRSERRGGHRVAKNCKKIPQESVTLEKKSNYKIVTTHDWAMTPCSIPLVPCDLHENAQYKSKKSFPNNQNPEEDPLLISIRLKSGELLKTSTEILEKLCRMKKAEKSIIDPNMPSDNFDDFEFEDVKVEIKDEPMTFDNSMKIKVEAEESEQQSDNIEIDNVGLMTSVREELDIKEDCENVSVLESSQSSQKPSMMELNMNLNKSK